MIHSGPKLLFAQIGMVFTVLGAVALAPPAQGRMLLVPLWPSATDGMIARATLGGARLLGRGPIGGSFVVTGNRAAIAQAMLSHGVLVLAAPATGCGPNTGELA